MLASVGGSGGTVDGGQQAGSSHRTPIVRVCGSANQANLVVAAIHSYPRPTEPMRTQCPQNPLQETHGRIP